MSIPFTTKNKEDLSPVISPVAIPDTIQSWLEINQQAFEHNVTQYKNIVGPTVDLALVIKSNAYGHGILEIGAICQQHNDIAWLCTTTLSEAILLRQHGITKPILVLSLLDQDLQHAITHHIDVMAYTMPTIQALNHEALLQGKRAKIHIKIDTGLSRFGLSPEQAVPFIQQVVHLPGITINGIFSHLAESDNSDKTYTIWQQTQFANLLDQLTQININIPYRHASNSVAITTLPKTHFNMVRLGAGAYGLQSSSALTQAIVQQHPTFDLQPVMTWKTKILDIRTVPADSYVGYNRTHQTTQITKIALLPVGYYEGYDRRFSNKGVVGILIPNSHKLLGYAPVIGRICMNVMMVDITHLEQAAVGDQVVLMGNYPGLHAHELAHTIESFNPREITTRLNSTLPRIIV